LGQEGYLSIENCGTSLTAIVVMRAVPGTGGMTLATDDKIQPTKTVVPSGNISGNTLYTYTIRLEQLSSNTTEGLDAVYDVLPKNFKGSDYVAGSCELSIDGGPPVDVPDPGLVGATGENDVLVWPLDYDWEAETGAFSSDPLDTEHYFAGIRDFEVRQVKELSFQIWGDLGNNAVHCNWAVLKPWNTVSGPQAPITVGEPDEPGVCVDDDVIEIAKSVYPDVILPGVPTEVRYDIYITNNYGQTRSIEKIIDYLPPEFYYLGPTSNLTDQPQQGTGSTVNINGVERYKLEWTQAEFGYPGPPQDISIASGETLCLTFLSQATKDVSGSYYNEVSVVLKTVGIGQAFEAIGVTPEEYTQNYSWNQGSVTVPAYDSRVEGEGMVIDSNLSMVIGGISITSFRIR